MRTNHMRRPLQLLSTLLTLILVLAACGSSSEVGTASGDVPEETDEPTAIAEPESVPIEIDGEHVITNDVMVDPRLTDPIEVLLNPENSSELWVRFVGGDPNCTAASAELAWESSSEIEIELSVGITEDALSRTCADEEFRLRVDVPLNESGEGKILSGAVTLRQPIQLGHGLLPEDFVGLSEAEAAEIAGEHIEWRNIEVEGEALAVTDDYRPDRLNFVIEGGVVTVATRG